MLRICCFLMIAGLLCWPMYALGATTDLDSSIQLPNNNLKTNSGNKIKNYYRKDLISYYQENKTSADFSEIGVAHGTPQIAEDFLQSVGQVIVNKATNESFSALKSKVQDLLGCKKTSKFPQTCLVLENLRLEEITASYTTLYNALLSDLAAQVIQNSGTDDTSFGMLEKNLVGALITELNHSQSGMSSNIANIIISSLSTFLMENAKEIALKEIDSRAVFIAGAALIVAEEIAYDPSNNLKLEEVNVTDILAKINEALQENQRVPISSVQYTRAMRLASNLIKALTAKKGNTPDVRTRVFAAADALFEATLMFKSSGLDEKAQAINQHSKVYLIFILRDIVDAMINKDINALVTSACAGIQEGLIKLESGQDPILTKRGIQYIGAIVLYAQTYLDTSLTEKQAQANRTSILTSLVQERTSSSGLVFSAGGALRGVLGSKNPRINENGAKGSFFWAVSLPIGFGADWYIFPGKGGTHVDVNVFDLGQFVSYNSDKKVEVQKPGLADVFYPSATVGLFLGANYPVCVGYTIGYSPNYSAPEGSPLKGGSVNQAVAIGLYVPLFDFN
jgi:hypothetical protein